MSNLTSLNDARLERTLRDDAKHPVSVRRQSPPSRPKAVALFDDERPERVYEGPRLGRNLENIVGKGL